MCVLFGRWILVDCRRRIGATGSLYRKESGVATRTRHHAAIQPKGDVTIGYIYSSFLSVLNKIKKKVDEISTLISKLLLVHPSIFLILDNNTQQHEQAAR